MDNLGNYSTYLSPHYQNSFFLNLILFSVLGSMVSKNICKLRHKLKNSKNSPELTWSWHFRFSKHQPSGLMLSISRNVRLSVCVFVRLFTFEIPFKRLFAPLPKVNCPKIFEIRNPWGKAVEISGLRFEHFLFGTGLKLLPKKNNFFWLILSYKTCWKPRLPMDERPLIEGYIANFGISQEIFEFLRFG